MNNSSLIGHLLALTTVVIWGTTFIATKVILPVFSPLAVLLFRFLLACLLLLCLRPQALRFRTLREEVGLMGLGLTGVTLYFLFENVALQYTLASNAGLLVSVSPIITALLAHRFARDERLRAELVWGFVLAISGVFLVMTNGHYVLRLNPLGDCLALAAALAWGVYSILLKRAQARYNPVELACKTFFYGLLWALPSMIWLPLTVSRLDLARDWPALVNLAYLGVAASSLCFVMWNGAVRRIGVVKTSNYIYLVPLITMVTAAVILGERLTPLMLWGGGLILSGIYVAEHGLRWPAPSPCDERLGRENG